MDVRAILQASEHPFDEQASLQDAAGTVLTVQAYAPTATSILPSGDVTVKLRGLTIPNGLARQGGGIVNLGHLTVVTSTIHDNAAYNLCSLTTGGCTGDPGLEQRAQGGGSTTPAS